MIVRNVPTENFLINCSLSYTNFYPSMHVMIFLLSVIIGVSDIKLISNPTQALTQEFDEIANTE